MKLSIIPLLMTLIYMTIGASCTNRNEEPENNNSEIDNPDINKKPVSATPENTLIVISVH